MSSRADPSPSRVARLGSVVGEATFNMVKQELSRQAALRAPAHLYFC